MLLSDINLRGLMSQRSTPAEQLARRVRGAAIAAAAYDRPSVVVPTAGFEAADILEAVRILEATNQYKFVNFRSYPMDHIEAEW